MHTAVVVFLESGGKGKGGGGLVLVWSGRERQGIWSGVFGRMVSFEIATVSLRLGFIYRDCV